MKQPPVARHKTAIAREHLSRPLAQGIADGICTPERSVFDYGCGRGDDIRNLRSQGFTADGWDPFHPSSERRSADVVNLGFVVNVIEDPLERREALCRAWALSAKVLIVAARMTWERGDLDGRALSDGLVTRAGTFQKFFEQQELSDWIYASLGRRPHAAAPGIFYIFRDEVEAQSFVASKVYRPRPRLTLDPLRFYQENASTLAPVHALFLRHGREPRPSELSDAHLADIVAIAGSLRRASRLVRSAIPEAEMASAVRSRRTELLVYAALSRFRGRPRFSDLDPVLATDIRVHWSTYRELCRSADRVLSACGTEAAVYFAARRSRVGKQTATALYLHESAVASLPPVLQVYEGCARLLTGSVPGANIVKLHVVEPVVSFMNYPDFDEVAHPTLALVTVANLRDLQVHQQAYHASADVPVLHRKEEFLTPADPRRPTFQALSEAETAAGLYSDPTAIRTIMGWASVLRSSGFRLNGHRLERR